MGAERPPGISHPMCGEQFEAAPARAHRFVSIASHRSEGADGRVARSHQENAEGWKDSARRIIRSFARRNRAGRYQRTKDGTTRVWNENPKTGDLVTWSGARDT